MRSAATHQISVVDLITTDQDKTYEPAGRMAMAIISITEVLGVCLPQDLNERGFKPEQVAQHWHLAKSIAAIELRLMQGGQAKNATCKIY